MKNSNLIIAGIAISACTWTGLAQAIEEDLRLFTKDVSQLDRFGSSIAIDDGIIAVGAERSHEENIIPGSAYLFDASTGLELAKLVASAAEKDDSNGSWSGSVYLFDATTGAQLHKLVPSDGASNDRFGSSIAIDNGIVAVGARLDDDNGTNSGSVYLFDATTGEQLTKLLPSDGTTGDLFGASVDIHNGMVAVGAYFDWIDNVRTGSAYLFDATTGTQLAKLLPEDGAYDDRFGTSVAIGDGIIAVGSQINDDFNFSASGSVYLFDENTKAQLHKVTPNDRAIGDWFGDSIAIEHGILAVGSVSDDALGRNSGSAYLFDTSTAWQVAKIVPSDGAAYDGFGSSIAINNGVVAVGARFADIESGSAYVFSVPTQCLADLTGDGQLDFFDISDFLRHFREENAAVDFYNDGIFDFFDVSAFLDAFAQGCP